MISGPELIRIPGQGYKKIVDSGIISKFVVQAFGVSQYLFQKGIGREDEIFEEIIDKLPNCNMVMSTSIDDNKGIRNYQFFNEGILTNSVVNLGLSFNLDIGVCTTHGMKETDKKFNITKLNRNKHIILKINNSPAVPELYKILNWPNNFLNEETMHYRILYYPISLRRHGRDVPVVMPAILKDYIVTPCIIDKGEVKILTISGRDLIYAIQNNLESFGNIRPEFGLCSTCSTIMQTMGNKIYVIKEKMVEYFKDKPFLMFFCAGEGTYSPTQDYTYANMSYNTAIFGQ
ncbi:MAG: FIST N-terminal domain-containing protein [Candidatus Thermoplasmatota archaeon]|nr:FIST N-terminal domain-containing protein [Candidatus Thermoplasmatota archaeon]